MSLTKKSAAAMAVQPVSTTPYQLDPAQTLRAANALLKKMQADALNRKTASGKADLLSDTEDTPSEPIWLCVTTKKHITDKKSLKPGKISLPHALPSPTSDPLKVCLLTADPQREYKDLIDHPNFPASTRGKIARVLGLSKLKAKYKSFEAKRQLLAEYDLFLADDRVVIHLPKLLGKVFYHGGSKRPIPVNLQGRREDAGRADKRKPLALGGTKVVREQVKPESIANEVEKALGCAYVHLSPGTNTSVRVGTTDMPAGDVVENMEKVVEGLVAKYIPQGWRNVKGLHVKGPNTASLPIWLADELWESEADVLERDPAPVDQPKKRKAKAIEASPLSGVSGGALKRQRSVELKSEGKESKKRKSDAGEEVDQVKEKAEKKARKEALKTQKEKAMQEVRAAA